MWTYRVTTGVLLKDGVLCQGVKGYSGAGTCTNVPADERKVNEGPVPRGRYTIGLPPFDSETHGPVVMQLHPEKGTDTFGRGGFLIHGDSVLHPGHASHGCIILPRAARLAIAQSGDSALEVTA